MAAAGQRTRPGRRLGDRAERGGTRRGSAWRGRGRARGGRGRPGSRREPRSGPAGAGEQVFVLRPPLVHCEQLVERVGQRDPLFAFQARVAVPGRVTAFFAQPRS